MKSIRRPRSSRFFASFLLSSCLAVLLAGCGGGGDSTNTAEGFYTGTLANGNPASLLVLENGQSFGLSLASGKVAEGLYGSLLGVGTGIRGGVGQDFNFAAHTDTPVSWSGSVTPSTSITASTTSGVTFNGNYRPGYTDAPNVAGLAGSYVGTGIAGIASNPEVITVNVDGNGAISFNTAACTVTGALYLRGNGKNVYSVRLNFSGTSCGIPNGYTTAGSAYLDRSVSPARFYLFTLRTDTDNDGFYWTSGYVV